MKILIVSKAFPDEDACALRECGHDVNCARDVKAAQRCVNDGYAPDLIYIDNRLDSAQFFAKQVRSGHETSEIYVMLGGSEAPQEDPSRLGIDGYIVGGLTVERVLERAGDLRAREAEPEVLTETVTTAYVQEKRELGEGERAGEVGKERITLPRLFKGNTEKEREGRGEEPEADEKKHGRLFRLAFPAVVGTFALAALLNAFGPRAAPTGEDTKSILSDITGMTCEESIAYIEGEGIPYEVVEVRSEDGSNTVVDQEPPGGTRLAEVDSVTIMVSIRTENEGSAADLSDTAGDLAKTGGDDHASPPSSPAPSQAPIAEEPAAVHAAPTPARPATSKPVVSVSASRTSGPSSGFIATLSASAYDPDGGSIVSYAWSCGGSGPVTSHEFASNIAPSTVVVTVTVTDDEGETASGSVSISLF